MTTDQHTDQDQGQEPQPITDEQLLPFVIADELRARQAARGETNLRPLPPCPLCGAPVDEIPVRHDRLLRRSVLGFVPCGDLFFVPDGTAARLADAVLAGVKEQRSRTDYERPSSRTTPNNSPASDDADNSAPSMLAGVLAAQGVSQADLARRTGISTKHINHLCQGTARMSVDTALRLEVVLGVAAEEWLRADTARRIADNRDQAALALLRPLHVFIEGLKHARLDDEVERARLAQEADATLGVARGLEGVIDRVRERCQEVRDRVGPSGMINASQILGMLSPTWPDGNHAADGLSAANGENGR